VCLPIFWLCKWCCCVVLYVCIHAVCHWLNKLQYYLGIERVDSDGSVGISDQVTVTILWKMSDYSGQIVALSSCQWQGSQQLSCYWSQYCDTQTDKSEIVSWLNVSQIDDRNSDYMFVTCNWFSCPCRSLSTWSVGLTEPQSTPTSTTTLSCQSPPVHRT